MTEKQPASINIAVAYAIAAVGALVAGYCVVGSLASLGTVNDLPQYYAAADMLLRGQGKQIYNFAVLFQREQALFPSLTRGIGLFLPPLSLPLLLPLLLMPPSVVPLAWTAICALGICLSLVLTSRHMKLSRQDTLWLFGLALLSGPVIESIRLGQLAPIMLLALTLFALSVHNRETQAGMSLVVLLFKPQQLVPLLLFCAGSLRNRLLFATLLPAAALFVVAFVTMDMAAYIQVVRNPNNLALMQPQLSPTLRGELLLIFGQHCVIANVVAGCCWLLAAAVIVAIAYRNRLSANWLRLCLMVALPVGLVTSLHCHDYDLILLIPGLVQLPRTRLWHQLPTLLRTVWMLALAAFLQPFYTDIHYGYLLKGGICNPYFIILLCLSCYLAWVAWKRPEALETADISASAATL